MGIERAEALLGQTQPMTRSFALGLQACIFSMFWRRKRRLVGGGERRGPGGKVGGMV
jgi:hypothetical protein